MVLSLREWMDIDRPLRHGVLRRHIPPVLAGAILYLLFVEMYSNTLADYDLWGYLAFGRAFWETEFPSRDLFSYTPTKPLWIYHEWLTGVLFYPLYRQAGEAGLQLLRYVLILTTLYLIYLTSLRRGGTPLAAGIALVPAMLLMCFGYVPVRAQVFTYLFFTLTLYILELYRTGQRWRILGWLPAIMVLWCNFHGGFLAGVGLIALYAIGEGLQGRTAIPLIAAGILSGAATLVNPYGIAYWHFTASAVMMPRPEIKEWASFIRALNDDIYAFAAWLFAAMALLCLVGCLARRTKNFADILVTAVVLSIGASHIRHTVFMGIVFGAYVPVLLTERWRSVREARSVTPNRACLPAALFVCLALLAHSSLGALRIPALTPSFRITTPLSKYPLGALNWIMEKDLRGNILPLFDWGEFIIWYLSSHCRVAMDGRYETVYQEHVHREYFDFLFARPAWRVFLQKYPHEMILLPAGIAVTALLKGERDWQVAYSDRETVLFLRKRGGQH